MALPDILAKIKSDMDAVAQTVLAEGEQHVAQIEAQTAAEIEEYTACEQAAAHKRATQAVGTVLIDARLQARDKVLRAYRQALDEVFAHSARMFQTLDDDRWLHIFVPRIVEQARAGEQIALGSKDFGRVTLLQDALGRTEGQRSLTVSDRPADFEYGVLITGEKTCVDLSVEQIIEAIRRAVEPDIQRILFDKEAIA